MNGKNAIITGATRGIGKAIVQLFAQNGINVWACGSVENDAFIQEMAVLAEKYQVWIKCVFFDLQNEDEIKKGINQIFSDKEPIDILVNNAGIPYTGTMQMTPIKKLREVLDINFISQIIITQLVSRKMMRQKKGSIINIGSIGGIEAREGYLAYGSSKAALLWATRSISKELAPYNIRVNAVAPGLIDTSMGNHKNTEEIENIISNISIKRFGTPNEVAEAVLFLASEKAAFITGTVLNVDGGRII